MNKKINLTLAKEVLAVALVSVAFFCLHVGGTRGFLKAEDSTENMVMAGETDGEISEIFAPKEIKPGETIDKCVSYANTGKLPCFVRAKIIFSTSTAAEISEIYGMDESKWTYSQEQNTYFYKDVLLPGASTSNLMEGIHIKTIGANMLPLTESDMSDFDVFIYFEAVHHEDHDFECDAGEYISIWEGK